MYIFWVSLRRVAGHFAFVSIKFPLNVRPGFVCIVSVLFVCMYVCQTDKSKKTEVKNSIHIKRLKTGRNKVGLNQEYLFFLIVGIDIDRLKNWS